MPRLVPAGARACALALAVALGYAASNYQADLNVRRPRVLRVAEPHPVRAGGPAARVVWVLVDGLRLDASRRMAALDRIRAAGADVAGRAEFPTYTAPNIVAQATGIEPAGSGVQTNGYPGEVALDSVFRRAKLEGLRTAILIGSADVELSKMFRSWTNEVDIREDDLPLPAADLVLVHIGYVDQAAHAAGAASPEYRAAVDRADDQIDRIARTLDPGRDALIVTSDHGHLDRGGHGGSEREVVRIPLVVWGAGAVRRTGSARGRDVGPTIARLLGLGPLAHATGRSLLGGDVASARQRTAARATLRASGTPRVDHVPLSIPVAVIALVVLGGASGLAKRPLAAAPYALVFTGLVFATNTVSYSVANDPACFGARLGALSALAMLAQLRLGGRASLAPAALVASVAVLVTAVIASHQPLAPADGTLRFLPIPALGGLAFACLTLAAVGRTDGAAVEVEQRWQPPAVEDQYASAGAKERL